VPVTTSRECPQRTGGDWKFSRRKSVKAGQGKAKLVLVLPAPLIAQLRAHRMQQAAERLVARSAWLDWDLVFATPTGAPIDSQVSQTERYTHVTTQLARGAAQRMAGALWDSAAQLQPEINKQPAARPQSENKTPAHTATRTATRTRCRARRSAGSKQG
jgi:hypothetical protein